MLQRSARFASSRPKFSNAFPNRKPRITAIGANGKLNSMKGRLKEEKHKGNRAFRILFANIGQEFSHLNWSNKILKHTLVLTSKNDSHESKHIGHNFVSKRNQLFRITDQDLKKLDGKVVATTLYDQSVVKDFHQYPAKRVPDKLLDDFHTNFKEPKIIDHIVCELKNRFLEANEWDEIIKTYGKIENTTAYSMNMHLQSIMDFLLASNIDFTNENSDLRSDCDWYKKDLVQSYVDYILTSEACHLHFQGSLMKYVYHCCDMKDWIEVERVYRIVDKKVDLIQPNLVAAFTKGLKHASSDVLDDLMNLVSHINLFVESCTKQRAMTHQRVNAYNDVVQYALRNNNLEVALNFTGVLINRGSNTKTFHLDTLEQFLNKFSYSSDPKTWKRNRQVVEVFLNLLSQRQYFLANESYAELVLKWFKNIKNERWAVRRITIPDIKKCQCPITGVPLLPSDLGQDEHYLLKSFVLITIMKKLYNKIHMETLAQENMHLPNEESIHHFFQFILMNGPFNVVVDGLNVILHGVSKKNGLVGSERYEKGFYRLATVLDILHQGSTKEISILVTLKQHMKSPTEQYKHLFKDHNVQFYFVPNDFADDSLIFYAAICSGPNCYFVSRDFFRDYKALILENLGHDAARLFYKYQQSRQITVLDNYRNQVCLGRNNIVETRIQHSDGVWHIPYADGQYVEDPNKFNADKFSYDGRNWLVLYDQDKHEDKFHRMRNMRNTFN